MPSGKISNEELGELHKAALKAGRIIKYTPPPKRDLDFKNKQKKLLDILNTGHSHPEIYNWINCNVCATAFNKYKEAKRKMGFQSTKQFMNWEKINNPNS